MDLVECLHCGHDRSEHTDAGCVGEDVDLEALTLTACACDGFSPGRAAVELDR